jgi:acyl carrier protein
MAAPEEIDARLKRVLVDALGVEEDDIKPAATLKGELGAESIDFLDIAFRLEREFRIKIPRGELFVEPVFTDDRASTGDGQVTDEYLAALRLRMPYADLSDMERDRRPSRVEDLYTVGLLASYVRWQLGGRRVDGDVPVPDLAVPDLTFR